MAGDATSEAGAVPALFMLARQHNAVASYVVHGVFVATFSRGRPDARRFRDALPDPTKATVRHTEELTRITLLMGTED